MTNRREDRQDPPFTSSKLPASAFPWLQGQHVSPGHKGHCAGTEYRVLGSRLESAAGTGASMVGQQALLLAGFFLPGFLLSEAAKILTTFALGEC